MNILDHRILIPVSQDTIWEYISNIADNPSWQADCNHIVFLSTRHTGPGVRWRYETSSGHAYVAEITAWYDKLGYEYTFVDGAPFRESKGRIRLQEIAEGTIVQWTFSYEMGGLFGGVRNTVGTKRQIESTMMESLRSLWSAIQKSGINTGPREVKSLMRDAPDYQARSTYKPRHPSNKQETPENTSSPGPMIIEPPISEEDTRPRAPAKLTTSVNEPMFLSGLPDSAANTPGVIPSAAPAEQPSQFARPKPVPQDGGSTTTQESAAAKAFQPLPSEPLSFTPEEKSVPVEQKEDSREMREISVPSALTDETRDDISFTTTTTTSEPPLSTDEIEEMDTSEVSVFDIFGIPRPSETQEMEAVNFPSQRLTDTMPMPIEGRAVTLRTGLRLKLRRQHIKIRRPISS